MGNEIKLFQLLLGQTDAKNELINYSKEEVEIFKEGFVIPDNVRIEDFQNGKKYFITGLKGTGKTALLRYIELICKKRYSAATSFILFKSDFIQNNKAQMVKLANNAFLTEKNDCVEFEEDFEAVWYWFFHRHIVRIMEESTCGVFVKDKHWEEYKSCVKSIKDDHQYGFLFPRVKGGTIELNLPISTMSTKIAVDLEFDEERIKVPFVKLVQNANDLFSRLTPGSGRLYIFVDELELSFSKQEQYQKDIKLIRDVIRIIYELNSLAKTRNMHFHIITGIRSEVVKATGSCGKEINKPIEDYGLMLQWQQRGNSFSHPLIKIINKKIRASESRLGIKESSDEEIWDKYFPIKINGKRTYEYILQQTWYRPRDVVRILSLIKEQYPDSSVFSHQMFVAIRKEYSSRCWTEQVEELNAKYTKEEIDGIKRLLSGIKSPFTFQYLKERVESLKDFSSNVEKLLNKYRLFDIMDDLFTIGVIGNTGRLTRFSFRGDESLLPENPMMVHNSLCPYLSVEKAKIDDVPANT